MRRLSKRDADTLRDIVTDNNDIVIFYRDPRSLLALVRHGYLSFPQIKLPNGIIYSGHDYYITELGKNKQSELKLNKEDSK